VSEANIEKRVCQEAKGMGISSHKWTSTNEKGLPDRIFIIPGSIAHWFCIEFKTPFGVVSPSQKRKIKTFQEMGVHVYVCDSVRDGIEILNIQKRAHTKRLRILTQYSRISVGKSELKGVFEQEFLNVK